MLLQGAVGNQQLQDGANNIARAGKGGELMVSELNGRYYELCYRGKVFSACSQSAVALSTLSSTYTGFIVANNPGTSTNLVILQVAVAVATAPAGVSNMHYEGTLTFQPTACTAGTALTTFSTLFGSGLSSVGLAKTATSTPNTPVAVRALGGGPNATGSVTTPFIVDDIAGQIILGPGTYLGLGYLTTAISVVASATWAELPQ
jgi:hypothetical protein